jgi:hypothetical protein
MLAHHDISRGKEGMEMGLRNALGKGVDAAFRKDADG